MCATRLISKLSEVLSGGGNCVVRRKDVTFMQLKKKKNFFIVSLRFKTWQLALAC